MKSVLLASTALAVSVASGFPQCFIEADLNGVLGEGPPDSIVATAGEEVPVDLWFMWEPSCSIIAIQVILCEGEEVLGYQATDYYPPSWSWYFTPPGPPDSAGCITLRGVDGWPEEIVTPPWKVATVTYRVEAARSIAEIVLGEGSGYWMYDDWDTEVPFLNNGDVVARIRIEGATETEPATWGRVKLLFR